MSSFDVSFVKILAKIWQDVDLSLFLKGPHTEQQCDYAGSHKETVLWWFLKDHCVGLHI